MTSCNTVKRNRNPSYSRLRLNTFDVFSMYVKLHWAYSPNTINTFLIFSKYAKINKNRLKNFSLLTLADDLKGTVFRKNLMGKLTFVKDDKI